MSLVNDALKKARRAQTATGATADGPALRPAVPSQPRRNPLLTLPFIAGIIAVLVLAAVLFAEWFRGATKVEARVNPLPQSVAPPSTPVIEPSTPAPVTPVVTPAPESPPPEPVATRAISATEASTVSIEPIAEITPITNEIVVASPPSAEPPPAPVNYKLQAIFFRPRQSAAMINRRTIYIGGYIDDARVVAIDQKSATIVTTDGRTNVLTLEDQ